MMITAAADD